MVGGFSGYVSGGGFSTEGTAGSFASRIGSLEGGLSVGFRNGCLDGFKGWPESGHWLSNSFVGCMVGAVVSLTTLQYNSFRTAVSFPSLEKAGYP